MTTIHGIGSESSLILRQLAGSGRTIFTHADVKKLWHDKPGSLNNFLYRLAKRRWIKRLERGKYMILPFEAGVSGEYTEHEFVIASRLVSPYMIGLWSAFNHHHLTEQIPDRVYLISPKTKHSKVGEIAGVSYRVLTIPRARFFGATFAWIGKEKVWITDLERTLLDAVLWPEHCGGFAEVAKAFKEASDKVDTQKLEGYALKMGRGIAFKRLGLLAEWLGWPPGLRRNWRKHISKGVSFLDPQGPKSGPQISRWNLRLNFNLEGYGDPSR